jgi:hypothetical protein
MLYPVVLPFRLSQCEPTPGRWGKMPATSCHTWRAEADVAPPRTSAEMRCHLGCRRVLGLANVLDEQELWPSSFETSSSGTPFMTSRDVKV